MSTQSSYPIFVDGQKIAEATGLSYSINQGKIESMFERVGFEVSNWNTSGNRFHARFTVSESLDMWKYMGDRLPNFSYKWPEVV